MRDAIKGVCGRRWANRLDRVGTEDETGTRAEMTLLDFFSRSAIAASSGLLGSAVFLPPVLDFDFLKVFKSASSCAARIENFDEERRPAVGPVLETKADRRVIEGGIVT